MPAQQSNLAELGLYSWDIERLSIDEQLKYIKKRYVTLALRHHPDKNQSDPLATERFQRISSAYESLKAFLLKGGHAPSGSGHTPWQPEWMQYIERNNIFIPDTAFDEIQQNNIAEAYENLSREFSALGSKGAKRAFGQHYGPFFNLALLLAEKQEQLTRIRVDCLYEQMMKEEFQATFIREWRLMMMGLYGEELLSDFQYREALASGHLYPVFATRKLLSPVKGIVAVLNSIILLGGVVNHLFKRFFAGLQADADSLAYSLSEGQPWRKQAAMLFLKIVGLISLLVVAPILIPGLYVPFLICLSLPLVYDIAQFIATPVNSLVRPLSNYLKVSPIGLSFLLAGVGAAAMYGLGILASMSSAAIMLQYSLLPLAVYSIYASIMLVKKRKD